MSALFGHLDPWREAGALRARAIDATRARLEAGEEITLADAIDFLPPGDWSPWPSSRLTYVAFACAGGELVASALGVDPGRPLTRLDVPADAWPSAQLVEGDFEHRDVQVLSGLTLFEVKVRRADIAGDLDADLSIDLRTAPQIPDPAAVFLPVALPVAPPPSSAVAAERLFDPDVPLPGALAVAAGWIVAQDRRMDGGELRDALAVFGLQLDGSGQSIGNSPDAADGSLRGASAGRHPLLARQLVEAFAATRDDDSVGSVAARARAARDWLAERFPSLSLPALRTFERSLSRRNVADET